MAFKDITETGTSSGFVDVTAAPVLTQADFTVPEFKKGSELYGVGSPENYSAMGAPPLPSRSKFVDVTAQAKPKGFVDVTETKPIEQPNEADNWIPTWEQAKKEGFALRAAGGLGLIDQPAKGPEQPDMSVSDSLKAIGSELYHNPIRVAKSLTRGLIEDPELLYPGLWEAWPAKVAAGLARAGKVAQIGATTARAGAIGGALESGAELAETGTINPQRVANTAAQFGVAAGTLKTAGEGLKAIKPNPKLKPLESQDAFETELAKAQEEVNRMRESETPKVVASQDPLVKTETQAFTEQELADHPSLESLGNVFKGDTHTEQTPVNAIHRVIADISLNDRASKIWRESLERMVPDQKVRERMTMAAEAADEHDKLLTDKQKDELLNGTRKPINDKGDIDTGLKGALPKMRSKIALTPDGQTIQIFDRKVKDWVQIPKEEYIKRADGLEFVINKLESLPSEENAIKVLKVVQDKLDVIGNQAKREGVIDNLRQNYITHVLDFSDSVLSKAQQQSLRDRILSDKQNRFTRDFAKHRVYQTIRDLEKRLYEAGEEMGLDTSGVKVQRDIARISEVYQKSFVNAIIQKRLTNFLAKQVIKLPDGKIASLLTKDYKLGFENNYEKFTGHGSEILKDYMVHPDLVVPLKHLFRQTDPGLVLKAASGISMLSKTVTTMASLFHATSLALARTVATPFGILKEIKTGFSGTRAALDTIRHDGLSKEVDDWARATLKFETEDIQQGILPGVAKSFDNFVTKLASKDDIRLTRKVVDPLDTHVLQTLNTFTWDFMHSAGKFATAQYLFAKIKVRNPELSDHVIRNEVAAFVNNTFGGLDWLKIADEVQNKTLKRIAMNAYGTHGRTWLQIAMFAPDWTLSTLRSYTKALPQKLDPRKWEIKAGAKGLFNPRTSGDLARRYVATNALMWLTILNGINIATSGHYIWENEDPTRIDLGDGTTMQAAKHSMEGPHWLLHPIKTGFNKMGYIPKTVAALGSDYVHTPLDVAKTIGEPFLPFQVSSAVKAPKGEKIKRGVASFVGLPIYGQTNKANTSPEVMMARKQQREATMRTNKEKKMERR